MEESERIQKEARSLTKDEESCSRMSSDFSIEEESGHERQECHVITLNLCTDQILSGDILCISRAAHGRLSLPILAAHSPSVSY